MSLDYIVLECLCWWLEFHLKILNELCRISNSFWNDCKYTSILCCILMQIIFSFDDYKIQVSFNPRKHWRCCVLQYQISNQDLILFFYLFLFILFYLFIYFFLVFWDRVSLYSPGCPGAHFVDQAGLELRNPPASASRVLGIKGVRHHARQIIILKVALWLEFALCVCVVGEGNGRKITYLAKDLFQK
jgi:hypothetical protein